MPYKDPADRRASVLKYSDEHKERIKAYKREWLIADMKANPEKYRLKRLARYAANPDKYNLKSKKWRDENPDKAKACCDSWKARNVDYMRKVVREYSKKRRLEDPIYKLRGIIRTRIRKVLVGHTKRGSSIELLGCSPEFLKSYLESQFKPGMSWDNHGEWHVDHKFPLSGFFLDDPAQLAQACHYTNLQPLWAIENLKKAARLAA